jgi:FAD/FMN-containing dehydrogenase/Fe-S oxidoreductase
MSAGNIPTTTSSSASDRMANSESLKQLVQLRPANWRETANVNASGLEADLCKNIEGEVCFDAGSKALYATDASNYRQVPIGAVVPRSIDDVVATVASCRKFGAPLLSRGAATSLAGQCCNVAVVIDWTKYLHGVLEINTAERWARVLPGTVCDELRDRALAASNKLLTWGPDPATHNVCTFGGMIGNNSCGAHAQMSGKTDNNIEELDVLLYDGTRMTVGWMTENELEQQSARGGRVSEVYRYLKSLRDHYAGLIRQRFSPIPRRVSGYNLDQLLPGADGRLNVARALVGSEGTLVTILKAKCKLIDARAERVVVMLGYRDAYEAADHVPEINRWDPVALEGMDDRLYDDIRKKGGPHREYLKLLPEGQGWLMVELGANHKGEALEAAHQLMNQLQGKSGAPSMALYTGNVEMQHLWELREAALGATSFVPGANDTWPGWEDSAVAPEKLGRYLRELRSLFGKYSYTAALYGHFGQGCIHTRADFDVRSQSGIRKWRRFMDEAVDLCVRYDGSLSGEHGDGQARGEFLEKMFGPELIQAFREFKSIWDPQWKMNPGKVIDANRFDDNLRPGAGYRPWEPETHFQWPEDYGRFSHAALRCVGVGKCRRQQGKRPGDDTMCPSFMVTHDEQHSTRGRAHLLWEMLHGDVISGGWRDENVKRALDLCLSCKGCKGDCPVNVDIATYKAEFLSHYWEGRIRPRSAYAFGWIDKWARMASVAPGFANLFTQIPPISGLMKLVLGMPQERAIPAFAAETFKQWFRRRPPRLAGLEVLLWPDTFNNYFKPETAQAAVEVLEEAGFQVKVPREHMCCGRPLYDHGFLDMAKSYLDRVMTTLAPAIEAGMPMVVLEPSCCSVFRDELNGLFPNSPLAHRLAEQTFTLAEFLEKKAPDFQPPRLARKAIVQGHCHHKAIMRLTAEEQVLAKMGVNYEVLTSGCCGMAGAFGFEQDKYDISVRIGERVLLPQVRDAAPSTIVIADGFSCKDQIEQQTSRRALHLAEVMALAIREAAQDSADATRRSDNSNSEDSTGRKQPQASDDDYPERHFVAPRVAAQRRSMIRGAAIAGLTLAGVALGLLCLKSKFNRA